MIKFAKKGPLVHLGPGAVAPVSPPPLDGPGFCLDVVNCVCSRPSERCAICFWHVALMNQILEQ